MVLGVAVLSGVEGTPAATAKGSGIGMKLGHFAKRKSLELFAVFHGNRSEFRSEIVHAELDHQAAINCL